MTPFTNLRLPAGGETGSFQVETAMMSAWLRKCE
jgi:hypothetical protein